MLKIFMTQTRNAAASPSKNAKVDKTAPREIVLSTIEEPTLSNVESDQDIQPATSRNSSKSKSQAEDFELGLVEREKSIVEKEKRLAAKERRLKEKERDLKKSQACEVSAPGPSAPVPSAMPTASEPDNLSSVEKLRKAAATQELADGIINQCPPSFSLEMSNLAMDVGHIFSELPNQIMNLVKDETAVRHWMDRLTLISKKLSSSRRLYAERVSDDEADDGYFTIRQLDSWVKSFIDKFNLANTKKFTCSDLKTFFQGETAKVILGTSCSEQLLADFKHVATSYKSIAGVSFSSLLTWKKTQPRSQSKQSFSGSKFFKPKTSFKNSSNNGGTKRQASGKEGSSASKASKIF